MENIQSFTDENGAIHYAADVVSKDSEGFIFSTKNPGIFVRVFDDDIEFNETIEILRAHVIESVSPFLGLILPLAFLKEKSKGFLFSVPKEARPLWAFLPVDEDPVKALEQYRSEGGLKRRLAILADVARALIRLNSTGIMYGPISPSRIFVSLETQILVSCKTDFAARFIPDNSDDLYKAPETANGRGAGVLADVFSFAKLTRALLTHNGLIKNLGASFLELDALLIKAEGSPEKRPKISSVLKSILRMQDVLVTCKKCANVLDAADAPKNCPICESPSPKYYFARISDEINGKEFERGQKAIEFANARQSFYSYHTEAVVLLDSQTEAKIDVSLRLTPDKKLSFIFKNLMEKEIDVNGKALKPGATTALLASQDAIIISFLLGKKIKRKIVLK